MKGRSFESFVSDVFQEVVLHANTPTARAAKLFYLSPPIAPRFRSSPAEAFAPGQNDGPPPPAVVVTLGVFQVASDDNDLAFAIGHELAHLEFEHSKQLFAYYQSQSRAWMASLSRADMDALEGLPAKDIRARFSQSAQGKEFSRYQRVTEDEADERGMQLAHEAGYKPAGDHVLGKFRDLAEALNAKDDAAHRAPGLRAADLEKMRKTLYQ
jgi:predicted Zn-dependent protease